MYKEATIDGFKVVAKVFEVGSPYGIDGGKISKLWIAKDGITAVNFDRGWDVKPNTAAFKAVYKKVLEAWN